MNETKMWRKENPSGGLATLCVDRGLIHNLPEWFVDQCISDHEKAAALPGLVDALEGAIWQINNCKGADDFDYNAVDRYEAVLTAARELAGEETT